MAKLTELAQVHREMTGLAQAMVGVLEKHEMEALADLWPRRKRLWVRLEALGKELAPVFAGWEGFRAGLDPQTAAQADEQVESIRRSGRRTLDLDAKSAELMGGLKDEAAQALGNLSNGRKIMKAYRGALPKTSGPPRRISTTG